jgi:hypothetical protein
MKTIFKYKLAGLVSQTIEMPVGAEILDIQVQNGIPCIWALCDPYYSLEKRVFELFGTGGEIPYRANRKYIGTYQLNNGNLVFHCFELLE